MVKHINGKRINKYAHVQRILHASELPFWNIQEPLHWDYTGSYIAGLQSKELHDASLLVRKQLGSQNFLQGQGLSLQSLLSIMLLV